MFNYVKDDKYLGLFKEKNIEQMYIVIKKINE